MRIPRFPLHGALRQTLLYGASIALMKGISLLMLPFIAHHLAADAFGRLEVISSLAIIGSILVGMGLEDALYRFVGSTRDPAKRKRLAASIFSLSLIIGGIALLAGYLGAPHVAGWIPGQPTPYETRLVLAMLALEGCIAIPLGWLRMRDRALAFFLLSSGRAVLQAVLVLAFLLADRGVAGVLEAGLLAAIAQALALGLIQVRDSGCAIERNTFGRALVYSLPIVGSGLIAFALNGLDRWVLAGHSSLQDVAHFGVAAKFALAVVLLIQPFGMWWSPRRFEVLHAQDGHARATRMISLGLALTLLITVTVGLVAPLLIDWLLPAEYAPAAQYATALVLVMALREMTELINLGCFTGRTTRAQLLINLAGSAIGIGCMLWWAPQHGTWGVIAALLTAQLLRLALFYLASQHFLPLPYPLASLLAMAGLGLCFLSAGLFTMGALPKLLLIALGLAALSLLAIRRELIPSPARLLSP